MPMTVLRYFMVDRQNPGQAIQRTMQLIAMFVWFASDHKFNVVLFAAILIEKPLE